MFRRWPETNSQRCLVCWMWKTITQFLLIPLLFLSQPLSLPGLRSMKLGESCERSKDAVREFPAFLWALEVSFVEIFRRQQGCWKAGKLCSIEGCCRENIKIYMNLIDCEGAKVHSIISFSFSSLSSLHFQDSQMLLWPTFSFSLITLSPPHTSRQNT